MCVDDRLHTAGSGWGLGQQEESQLASPAPLGWRSRSHRPLNREGIPGASLGQEQGPGLNPPPASEQDWSLVWVD